MCDCVSLGRSANPMRFWEELQKGQHGWRETPGLLRFWGRVEKIWVNLRLVEILRNFISKMGQNSLTSENSCGSKNSGNHGPSARNNAAIFNVTRVPKNLGNCANPTIKF